MCIEFGTAKKPHRDMLSARFLLCSVYFPLSASAACDNEKNDYRRQRHAHDYPIAPYGALQLVVIFLVIKTFCHVFFLQNRSLYVTVWR